MNCANHADASAVAYCRTCGKALCANCTRPVRGVIYCEDCLGAKMEGAPLPPPNQTPYQQFMDQGLGVKVAPGPVSGPNPTVAGILSGFFPFGVGAVYTGQYAKGLAHLAIFVLLIAGANAADSDHSAALGVVCGFGIAFFWVYQIIDAVRSARAIQMAQPIPDPFGLAATFGGGPRTEAKGVPSGAIVLIVVGALLLLSTAGLFDLNFHRFWPAVLILVGAWIFATRWGLLGASVGCTCEHCRAQCLMAPAILVTIGLVGLIDSVHHVGPFGYAGAILLVVGGVRLFRDGASWQGHIAAPTPPPPAVAAPIPPPVPPAPPVPPTTEVNHG
jgi:hypothetical protein